MFESSMLPQWHAHQLSSASTSTLYTDHVEAVGRQSLSPASGAPEYPANHPAMTATPSRTDDSGDWTKTYLAPSIDNLGYPLLIKSTEKLAVDTAYFPELGKLTLSSHSFERTLPADLGPFRCHLTPRRRTGCTSTQLASPRQIRS